MKRKPFSVRIEESIYKKIKEEATIKKRSIAAQINYWLKKQIEENKETKEVVYKNK